VSALEIFPKENTVQYFANRFFPSELIFPKLEAFDRDIQLTVFGFPSGLGSGGKFSPLTFRTYLASGVIALPRFDTQTPCNFYLLENPSMGGYSGGPVIDISIVMQNGTAMTGEGTKLYGIIHGTINDETGGKLSAITPSAYILDLLEQIK